MSRVMVNPSEKTRPAAHPAQGVGFSAIHNGGPQELARAEQAVKRVLSHFQDLSACTLNIGHTQVILWGRGNLDQCSHLLRDGSTLILIGSPTGKYSWETVAEAMLQASPDKPFSLPWEGRVILLRIDPLRDTWTLWNDWVGSIPVFHARIPGGRIASTLEPAVVGTICPGEQDIFLPALAALLIWGHYFGNWTLFKQVNVVPPDSEAQWEGNTFHSCPRHSVEPSDRRWNAGWDELLEEMHALSQKAITSAIKGQTRWVIPLSSGLDSRLIAGVAAGLNADVRSYTWGVVRTSDVIHAENIARALGIPWKHLDLGYSYLTAYRNHWEDLFGSAMHFHGMYQIPFLEALRAEDPSPTLSGFLGDCLAGYTTKFLCETHAGPTPFQLRPDGYLHWKVDEVPALMARSVEDAFAELAAEVKRRREVIPGALHQQLNLLNIWGRQRHFTYFQSTLSAYWQGVATPYMDRDYARFSFSLPRAVLDERLLQKAMLRRYYPKLAAIPGTYASEPVLPTGSYILKKRVAHYLPESVTRSVFPGLNKTKINPDIQCVARDGKAAFYPVFERLDALTRWMQTDVIEKTYQQILSKHDIKAVRKLQSIQTLAFRLPN